MYYILLNIFSNYFPQVLNKQNVKYEDSHYLSKYINWQALLQKIQYQIKKTNIISLLILSLNKTLIVERIDILKKYLKKLEMEDIVITNKLLIFKGDFLIMCNITTIIY